MNTPIKEQSKAWQNLDFLLIALCGLVPYLWFNEGELLKSEDMRLPYTWEQWQQLFYVWHHGMNTGSELILDNCLLPFMFLPALLQKWGLSYLVTQKITFVIWYILPGFTMAYLLRLLYTGPYALAFRIGALSFYLFNLWLENIWIAFKPPLITAYAVIPLILALIIQIFKGKFSRWVSYPLFFIVCFFSSGMGNNPSEFGASIAPGLILLLSFFFIGKTWKNRPLFKLLIGKSLILISLWFIANLYWFLPQWTAIYRNIVLHLTGEITTISEMILWLNGVSQSTSFLNVLRMQGDWTWYQGYVDPYRSYASIFHSNSFFYILSWLVPFLVFIGLWNTKIQKRGFFFILTVLGLILSMGSHPPLGFIYIWLTKHVPLFWIFRSPYFKFNLWVCLGYSIFFGAGCLLIYKWVHKIKPSLAVALIGVFCLSNLVYAFPITTGRFFHSQSERTFLSPHRCKIPEYVLQAANWLNQQPGFFRYLTLPGDNLAIYDWGGINYGSFLKEFSNKNLASNYNPQYILMGQGAINQAQQLLTLVRDQIYYEWTTYTQDILSLLQIHYLLHEKDIRYDFYKGLNNFEGDNPQFIKEKLQKQKGIIPIKEFGAWEFYKISSQHPFIYPVAPSNTLLIEGPLSLFTWWTYLDSQNQPTALFFNPKQALKDKLFDAKKTSSTTLKTNQNIVIDTDQLKPQINPSSEGNLELYQTVKMTIQGLENSFSENFDGISWAWWDGEKNKIIFENNSLKPISINLSFHIFNIEIPRSFYVRIGEKILDIFELKENEKREILVKNILLSPGTTEINFYSPYRHTSRQEHGVRFGFLKDSFKYGLLSYEVSIHTENKQETKIRIIPIGMQSLEQKTKKINIDQRDIVLKLKSNQKKTFYEGKATLQKGQANISIEQGKNKKDFIEISALTSKNNILPSFNLPELSFKTISPTLHRIDLNTKSPFVLVFSESFHPMWKAFTRKKGKKHYFSGPFKINEFANGYYIDQLGSFTIWIEYLPQKLFNICLIITLLSLLLCCVTLCGFFLSKAFKKQYDHYQPKT